MKVKIGDQIEKLKIRQSLVKKTLAFVLMKGDKHLITEHNAPKSPMPDPSSAIDQAKLESKNKEKDTRIGQLEDDLRLSRTKNKELNTTL